MNERIQIRKSACNIIPLIWNQKQARLIYGFRSQDNTILRGWVSIKGRHKWKFWGTDNISFLDLDPDVNHMFICEKLSSCNLTFVHFLYMCYSSIKSWKNVAWNSLLSSLLCYYRVWPDSVHVKFSGRNNIVKSIYFLVYAQVTIRLVNKEETFVID